MKALERMYVRCVIHVAEEEEDEEEEEEEGFSKLTQ